MWYVVSMRDRERERVSMSLCVLSPWRGPLVGQKVALGQPP